MYRIKKKVAGESIMEVMVAMTIASIFILSAIELVGRSYQVIGETNKRIEAINLAQEGIEIVRNTRDTNWLKYSGEKRKNWLKTSDESFLDESTTETFIEADHEDGVNVFSNQQSVKDIYETFTETPIANDTNNGTSGETLQSDQFIVDKQNSYFRLYKNADGFLTTDENNGDASPYYRSVKVKSECANSDDSCEKKIKITSQVFWEDKKAEDFEKITIKSDLYDFYELD